MNAKQELQGILSNLKNPVLIGVEGLYVDDDYEDIISISDTETLEDLLNKLDFDYYDGYGSQRLFGIIYLMDDDGPVWLTRGEYDGSEWWEINRFPKIYLPHILKLY